MAMGPPHSELSGSAVASSNWAPAGTSPAGPGVGLPGTSVDPGAVALALGAGAETWLLGLGPGSPRVGVAVCVGGLLEQAATMRIAAIAASLRTQNLSGGYCAGLYSSAQAF
jgi:hypothetical protein